MSIEVTRMTEADIDGAIDTIQQAFAEDPYNNWVYPDRSKVQICSPPCIQRTTHHSQPPGLPNTKPRLPNPPLPLGHIPRSLPRCALNHQPQDPRLRNVAPSAAALGALILDPLPLSLVALASPNPHELALRPRRAQHAALLDLEGAAGGGAGGALDQ